MNPAAIVLQGLFLVICHGPTAATNPNTCEIRIANVMMNGTPAHENWVGVPPDIAENWKQIPQGNYTVKNLYKEDCKTNPHCNPFVYDSSLSNRELILDKSVTADGPKAPLITIAYFPIPDAIWSGSQSKAPARKFRGAGILGGGTDAASIKSVPQEMSAFNSGYYRIAESLILYYEQGGNFYLESGGATFFSSVEVPFGPRKTWTLVLSSEPYPRGSPVACESHPRHDLEFNQMLQYQGKATTFRLTGALATSTADPDSAAVYLFDKPYLSPPCSPYLGKKTVDPTGCGPVILYDY